MAATVFTAPAASLHQAHTQRALIDSDLIASSPPLPQHELDRYLNEPSPGSLPPQSPALMSGTASVASDGFSATSSLSSSSPSYIFRVIPTPDYISQASAAQVATDSSRSNNNHIYTAEEGERHNPDKDAEQEGRAAVSERAIASVNTFLDKLLHDFIALAASTQLAYIRLAVADTLRKTLARDALAFADANLADLLALEDIEEEEGQSPQVRDSPTRWNLEYVWKRTRLRVMMRSELSDFDIDDDERFVQQEGLSPPGRRFSETASVVSLTSEIFLAGVLDFLSEQIFTLAAYQAVARIRRVSKKSVNGAAGHFIVDEQDVEKAVLNSGIDRLWRNWRKSLRARGFGITGSPMSSRHGYSSSLTSTPELTRRGSQPWGYGQYQGSTTSDLPTPRGMPGAFLETPMVERAQPNFDPSIAENDYPEYILASNIPLPQGLRDVDEIEVPGLAKDPDEVEDWPLVAPPRRQSSYTFFGLRFPRVPQTPAETTEATRPTMPTRHRSSSAPAPSPGLRRNLTTSSTGATPTQEKTLDSAAEPMTTAPIVDVPLEDSLARAQEPHTIPAGAALAGVAAGGAAAIAAATAIASSNHPLEPVHFSTDTSAPSTGSTTTGENAPPSTNDMREETRHSLEGDEPKIPSRALSNSAEKVRNREAAVDLKSTNPITVPIGAVPVSAFNQSVTTDDTRDTGRLEPPQLRSQSPGSDTEDSDLAKSPREFLASRNISTTRSPGPISPSGSQPPTPQSRILSKISMTGIDNVPSVDSPVSPLSTGNVSAKFAEATKNLRNDRSDPSRSPSTSPKNKQEEFVRPRTGSKTSLLGQKDLGSDAMTAIPRRESSLRRLAVDRHGSLVSLVDESSYKIRSKLPLTSSSITSAEDFDSLIAGGETIKMTLSPSTVREQPVAGPGSRNSSVDHSAKSRSGSSGDISKRSGSIGGDIAKSLLGKRPPLETVASDDSKKSPKHDERGRSGSVATTTSGRSFSRPSVRNKSKTRTGLMAREPTVQTDSTRDFADFIRSTGPDREPQTLVPALTTRTRSSVSTKTDDRNGSVSGRSMTKSIGASDNAPPMPSISQNAGIKIKSNLQAREARGSEAGNSELIDFIRTGPNAGKKTRIDKDIAPFRLTMDSDELGGMSDQVNMDIANGKSPNLSTNSLAPEGRSSISTMNTYNSRAPLVSNGSYTPVPSATQPAYASTIPKAAPSKPSPKPSPQLSEDGRKRYRNKDPYAIDFSDDDMDSDDEDPLTALPQQGTNRAAAPSTTTGPAGGSLGDFLRPTALPPPSTSTSTSGLGVNNISYIPQSSASYAPAVTNPTPSRPAQASIPTTTAAAATTAAAPAEKPKGYIPRNPNRTRVDNPMGAPPRRSNGIQASGTSELADFFKNSAPPTPATRGPVAAAARRDVSGGAPSPNIGGNRSLFPPEKPKDKQKEKSGGRFWGRGKSAK